MKVCENVLFLRADVYDGIFPQSLRRRSMYVIGPKGEWDDLTGQR